MSADESGPQLDGPASCCIRVLFRTENPSSALLAAVAMHLSPSCCGKGLIAAKHMRFATVETTSTTNFRAKRSSFERTTAAKAVQKAST
ncbi:hypothetical protein EVAR_2700_1 [Eumeta japonica]|uniref:Uncharacterized protein n=1 Tax=Eumeta variegata TaxID=151549 RepID=A0A4C1SPY8_EUMVA|nr:hypothetical protein EVAR_2700_1 [Eumeta japonica]